MKKTLVALGLFIAGMSTANASVLCQVITKDPRYNVSSYVRAQTACKTTSYAGTLPLPKMLLIAAGLYAVGQILNNVSAYSTPAEIVTAKEVMPVTENKEIKTLDEFIGPVADLTKAQYQPVERAECFKYPNRLDEVTSCISHLKELDKFCSDNPEVTNEVCYRKGIWRKDPLASLERTREDLILTAAYQHVGDLKEQRRHKECHGFLKIADTTTNQDSKEYWNNLFKRDCNGVVIKKL